MFKKAAAFILGAVIMAGASTAAYAENVCQTVVVEQEYGASATKTWDGKSTMKSGTNYVLKKSVTISKKITLPKGSTLTVNKGVKLGISSKGTLSVKGKLVVKSGATVTVTGKLVTYSGSTVSDSGTIKLTSNKASVTIGGTFTINKGGKLTGAPKSLSLGKSAKVTVKGTNSCKKLKELLAEEDADEPAVETDTDADKAEIQKLLNSYVKKTLKGDLYGAMCDIFPQSYIDDMDKEIQEYYGMSLKDFYNEFFKGMMEAVGVDMNELAKAADELNVKITSMTDCKDKLSDNQLDILKGCGSVVKAYLVKMTVEGDSKALESSGMTIGEDAEITAVYAGGRWYIIGM